MMMAKKYTIVTAGGRRLPLAAMTVSDATVAARAVAGAMQAPVQLEDDVGRRRTIDESGCVQDGSPPDRRLAA
jgi:hypothetical protein